MFVEVLDLLMPMVAVEGGSHELLLFRMEWAIPTKHKVPTSFAHDESCGLAPYYFEVFWLLENIFGADVRRQVDPRRNLSRSVPGIVLNAKVLQVQKANRVFAHAYLVSTKTSKYFLIFWANHERRRKK